jgi:ABC-2 type transport system permease protein
MTMGGEITAGGLPDLFSAFARALPPVAWAAEGYIGAKALPADVLSLLATLGSFTVVMALAPLNFLRDVSERGEMKRERKITEGGAELGALVPLRSVRMSLLRREWAVITSNSTFIFQLIAELLVLPLILLIYALVLPKEILGQALDFISASPLMGLIVLAVLVMMTNISSLSSTSLSREGKLFSLSLTMPASGRTQVMAKLALHMILLFTAYLVNIAVVFALIRLPPRTLVFLLPAGPIFEIFGFSCGIFFDLKRPVLKWTHPQQAVKNTLNAMIAPAGMFILIIVLGIPSFFLIRAGIDPFLLGCLIPVVPLILDAVLLPRILGYAERQYGGGLEMEA